MKQTLLLACGYPPALIQAKLALHVPGKLVFREGVIAPVNIFHPGLQLSHPTQSGIGREERKYHVDYDLRCPATSYEGRIVFAV
jgi:hypothetical protein